MVVMAVHGRGRRGSGRRRLRELTRSVVDTMEILEDVRGKHPGVGGMSKALVQMVKLWLQTCLTDGDERGSGGSSGPSSSFSSNGASGCGSNCAAVTSVSSSLIPPSKPGLTSSPSGTGGSGSDSSTVGNGSGSGGVTTTVTGSRGTNNIFFEGGAAAGGGTVPGAEEALPLGVASVLWELECCAAQARITLMNLMEGRPNHFGVFRAGVYVEEIRMLEAKILELVLQAANPPEEKNASLETTVTSGIRPAGASKPERQLRARLPGEYLSPRGDHALERLKAAICESRSSSLAVSSNCVARLWWSRRAGENAETMTWEAFQEAFQADFGEQLPKTLHVLRKHIAVLGDAPGAGAVGTNAVSHLSARGASSAAPTSPRSGVSLGSSEEAVNGDGARQGTVWSVASIEVTTEAAAGAAAAGAGSGGSAGAGETRDSSWEELMRNVETEKEGPREGGARGGTGAFGRSISRLLSSVRREFDVSGTRATDAHGRSSDNGNSDSGGEASHARQSNGDNSKATWRVTASKYEEVTWTHGGLYEAFQALADPRRVVFSMGVVDDGPHHEGGDGAEGWAEAAPAVVQGLLGLSVQQVCCGGQHAAVLTDCGEIFTWGRGGFGRLGHGNTEGTGTPKRIEALQGIPCVQVACGFAYAAAVTASGDLYTWGAGENGRLGLGDVEDRHTPSRVEGLHSKVREVYAGSVHSCVLTREGTVYAFGKHEYTGHGDDEDVLEPRLIPAFSGGSEALVRQISVGPGGYHTMALTCQGQVYAWGHNRVAQLGIGNSFTVPRNIEGAYFLPNPQLVESLLGMNIVKVVAGWGHSAALTKDGQVYVCGRNYQGQLGLGSPQHFPQNERGHPFQSDFCVIERLSHLKIRQIACGGEHSVAVAENGEVWSFGAGQKGQLGYESTREDFPRLVQTLKRTRREILHIACGNNCTLVLAGGVAFPSLFERAAAVIRSNPKLCADVDSLGLLPPSVVDGLIRTVDG